MNKGIFITFEGGDKVGKTTQIELLAQYLCNNNINHTKTREPGGTIFAQSIRNILLTQNEECDEICELLLFYAARADHINKVIKPALNKQKIILCDRFFDSSHVYQYQEIKKFPNLIKMLDQVIVKNLVPHRTYLLALKEDELKTRIQKAQKTNRYDNKKLQFHIDIQNRFLQIAQKNPKRFKIIDSSFSIKKVFEQILDDFCQNFGHIISVLK